MTDAVDPLRSLDAATLRRWQALHLSPAEQELLRRQGTVVAERRRRRTVYKLRFRFAGRQRARILGSDAAVAAGFRSLLAAWQAPQRHARAADRIADEARGALREAKIALRPLLEAAGFAFHGQAIRRRRKSPSSASRLFLT
jgi:hypothetical protein